MSAITKTAPDPTDARDLIAFSPGSHPDFLLCDDPRLNVPRDRPIVYVPSLVYLVHRLGGLGNIADLSDPTILQDRHDRVTIAEVAMTPREDGTCSLHLDEWHNYVPLLSIIFRLPARWHLGEWRVEHVYIEDRFSASAELDRLVAQVCNGTIGQALADPNVF